MAYNKTKIQLILAQITARGKGKLRIAEMSGHAEEQGKNRPEAERGT